ncbi:hypothetical protein ACAN107058_23775 [Paracidovorax anthurii]
MGQVLHFRFETALLSHHNAWLFFFASKDNPCICSRPLKRAIFDGDSYVICNPTLLQSLKFSPHILNLF